MQRRIVRYITVVMSGIALAMPALLAAQSLVGTRPITTLPVPVALEKDGRFQDAISRVGDDVFIAGQPTEQGLRDMRARGVTVVVNLRTPAEMKSKVSFDEPALVAQLGMKYVYLPVRGNAEFPYSPETVTKFADVMRSANGKVLLHCTVGWRASHLWAAYLITQRGVREDSALANARAINLSDVHHFAFLRGTQPIEEFLGRPVPGLGKGEPQH